MSPRDLSALPEDYSLNENHPFSRGEGSLALVVWPEYFGIDPQSKNDFEADALVRFADNLGEIQRMAWLNMRELLRMVLAVAQPPLVYCVKAIAGLVDQVFTADPVLTFVTEDERHIAILSSFRHPQRWPEREPMREFLQAAGFEIFSLAKDHEDAAVRDCFFEGLGETRFCGAYGPNGTLFVSCGPRGSREGVAALAGILRRELGAKCPNVFLMELRVEPNAKDQQSFHLDCAFATLQDGTILIYRDAFTEESLGRFDAMMGGRDSLQYQSKVIEIDAAMARGYATNLRQFGHEIIGTQALCNEFKDGPYQGQRLETVLQTRAALPDGTRYDVKTTTVAAFLETGGGVSCLIQQAIYLRRAFVKLPAGLRHALARLAGQRIESANQPAP